MKTRLINKDFSEDYGMNLLLCRGIEDIEWYLNPVSPKYLNDPTNLNYMEEGYNMLTRALFEDRAIALIVDSDNDGFTSAAIIYQYIKQMKPSQEIKWYLHSGKQHGLEDHIERLLDDESMYSLIIEPDAGSNDYPYHVQLKTPVLVLDHHLAEPPYAPNAVIINNQLSNDYTNKELTGAGVTWQFCRYIDLVNGTNYADDFIDLAAWGIIGDMGSILSLENRYIIYNGLNHIRNFFFRALIDKQDYSMGGKKNYISIAFYIVPLVNAMIRIGTQAEKERLFQAYIDGTFMVPSQKRGAKGQMEYVAVESARECTNARTHQNKIKDEAVEKIEIKIHKYDLLENKILFIELDESDKFPPELNGSTTSAL